MEKHNNDISKVFSPLGSVNAKRFFNGPHSRWHEIIFLADVVKEFIKGMRALHFVGPCITVFGSARFDEAHPYYILARQLGRKISELGFTTMTGGGPGIMEAANRGAKEHGGTSVGCNIVLAHEQKPNQYLDRWVDIDYFFIRKVLLTKYSYGFIVMPGGYGTLDEFFETIELIQTSKIQKFPVILFGKDYHSALFNHIENLKKEKTIDKKDADIFLFTDSVEETIEYIRANTEETIRKKHNKIRPKRLFGEAKISYNRKRKPN